jgi:hypothetical protein
VIGSPPLDPVLDSELDEVIDLDGELEPKHFKPAKPRVQEVPDEDDPNGGNDDDADEPPPSPNPSPSPSPPPSTHSPSPPPQPPPRKCQKTTHVAPTLASNRLKRNIRQPRAYYNQVEVWGTQTLTLDRIDLASYTFTAQCSYHLSYCAYIISEAKYVL